MSKETTQPGTPVTLTFEQLKELLAAAQSKPNVLEQKAIDTEIQKERKRDLARVELAKIETDALRRKKEGCTHCRWPMSAGKQAGMSAPRGQGEWCTSGQLHDRNLATMICVRCSYTWQFRPTDSEFEYISQNGMLSLAPPDESRVIRESVA